MPFNTTTGNTNGPITEQLIKDGIFMNDWSDGELKVTFQAVAVVLINEVTGTHPDKTSVVKGVVVVDEFK